MSHKSREIWIDNIKVVACILVVLGHFFQSMTKSSLMPYNDLYQWFIQTIYYFHVPLFFICSGYLYQQYSIVNSFTTWRQNIFKKGLALGIPYFTFSVLTWGFKYVGAGSINDESHISLLNALFVSPQSPYWFLYTLFFIFLITPTFNKRIVTIVWLVIAVLFKILACFGLTFGPVLISYILTNEIWFVLGICISKISFEKTIQKNKLKWLCTGVVGFFLFFLLSTIVYQAKVSLLVVDFLLGLLACLSVFIIFAAIFGNSCHNKVWGVISGFTMPIFLMHTLFAAPVRVILLKLGITNLFVHVICGLLITFIGPIFVAFLFSKVKWLEFFLYPNKVIKKPKHEKHK